MHQAMVAVNNILDNLERDKGKKISKYHLRNEQWTVNLSSKIGKFPIYFIYLTGEKKILPKKATRNVTLAALLIEEVTKKLATE